MATQPVALVTGGAIRVGRAISTGLAEDGYGLVVNYNSSGETAEELVDELGQAGHGAFAVQADNSDGDQVERPMGK